MKTHTIHRNQSVAILSTAPWSQLVAIKNCPCEDGKCRRVDITSQPTTYFSIPGRIIIKGKSITGFVTCNEEGYRFIGITTSKNYSLLKASIDENTTTKA
jgi:hypothetical protein